MIEPPLPERLGSYEIVRRLAYGGMAEVLLARLAGADGFSRDVVIKRVLPQHLDNLEFLGMFRDEARITANLYHGNIVQVLEFGELGGQYYLVLEYVDGPSLASVLTELRRRAERLTVTEAAHITVEVARALDYAHKKADPDGVPLAIVHRDVTPSNILLSREGVVKLADFGIAKARARLTPTDGAASLLKGKLAYMAPETVLVGRVDARSDLFALGAVVWEMLAGRAAFAADSEAQTLSNLTLETPPRPSTVNSQVPEELDALVMQLLERDPALRPGRGLEVVQALHRTQLLEGTEPAPGEKLVATLQRIEDGEHGRSRSAATPDAPRVLVVDESRTVRAAVRARLSERYRVLEASSADEAREIVLEEMPRLVMCQRSLRGTTGLQLCRWMRKTQGLSQIGFVLMASEVTEALREETRAAGGQAVVSKALGRAEIELIEELTR